MHHLPLHELHGNEDSFHDNQTLTTILGATFPFEHNWHTLH